MNFDTIRENWVGFRNDQLFFSYERCSSCGLLYAPIYLSTAQLDELYSSMPDNSAGEEQGVLIETQARYAKDILSNGVIAGRWLDVGADIGLLASALQEQLNDTNSIVDAVEPNLAVHDRLRANLTSDAFVFTRLAECESSAYAGIAAVHVLDHLPHLGESLQEIRRCLQSNGLLAVVVHNERSLLRKILGVKWPPFCLQHPQLFSPDSIRRTLELNGFTNVNVKRSINVFTLRHLFEIALRVLHLPVRPSAMVPTLRLPLRLGNIIVLARKA